MKLSRNDSGGSYTIVPQGTFAARCFSIIDLGTQQQEWQGTQKLMRKVLIQWEVYGEDEEGNDLVVEYDGKTMPMTISNRYTASLSEKAVLAKDLISWRGKAFTQEELQGFELKNVLGAPCLINVIHNKSKDGQKTYANIGSISPLPKVMRDTLPPAVHAKRILTLEEGEFDIEVFESLHDSLKDTIKKSPEYLELTGGNSNRSSARPSSVADLDDDIPF